MIFLNKIALKYLRWRHSKGFGIHSPFAFSIVENVINPGNYAYYGYAEIERRFMALRKSGNLKESKDFARFVLRLLVKLNVKYLIVDTSPSVILKTVAKAAGVKIEKVSEKNIEAANPSETLFLKKVMGGDIEKYIHFLESGFPILFEKEDDKFIKRIEEKMKNGLLLTDTKGLLAIPRPDMAFVRYDINLY